MTYRVKALYLSNIILERLRVEKDAAAAAESSAVENVLRVTNIERANTTERINSIIERTDFSNRSSVERTAREIENILNEHGKAVSPKIKNAIKTESDKFYRSEKEREADKLNRNAIYTTEDDIAVERVNTAQDRFAEANYEREAEKAKKLISGADAKEQEALKAKLGRSIKSKSYIQTAVSQVINNARSYSRMRFYDDAEIREFEVVAVMDNRTTEQCRLMNGKILSVPAALNNFKRYDTAESLDDVKSIVPWIEFRDELLWLGKQKLSSDMTGADLQALGLNAPPYHALCRTFVVASF